MAETLVQFIEATTEMCEAWDALSGALNGRDQEIHALSLDDGRVEVARRTKRMVDARKRVAAVARKLESSL